MSRFASFADHPKARPTAPDERRITRLKWVIGTPYFVQGTSRLAEIPTLYFIKFTLGMGDAGGQLFSSLSGLGWFLKPLWGLISDRLPIFGYRRRSWYVLMACLALLFWMLTAALAWAGVRVPIVYLLTFNLAFATYAFVDVVCDALMVTEGRRLGRVGDFVNLQWTTFAVALAASVLVGGWLQQKVEAGAIAAWLIFFLTGMPPLVTAAIGLRNLDEAKSLRSERTPHAGRILPTCKAAPPASSPGCAPGRRAFAPSAGAAGRSGCSPFARRAQASPGLPGDPRPPEKQRHLGARPADRGCGPPVQRARGRAEGRGAVPLDLPSGGAAAFAGSDSDDRGRACPRFIDDGTRRQS